MKPKPCPFCGCVYDKDSPAYPGWVSVEDRLPEKYVSVLIAYKDRFGDTSVAGGVINDQQEWVGIGLSIEPDSVTHWMPLPEAPEK